MPTLAKADEGVPVLIVGGGGAGLTASMLLAQLGVRHLLVNARLQTSDLPKAHVLNQRRDTSSGQSSTSSPKACCACSASRRPKPLA
jgi:cation diffusion facilitator CzcD-associated flavoprotein CzcO